MSESRTGFASTKGSSPRGKSSNSTSASLSAVLPLFFGGSNIAFRESSRSLDFRLRGDRRVSSVIGRMPLALRISERTRVSVYFKNEII